MLGSKAMLRAPKESSMEIYEAQDSLKHIRSWSDERYQPDGSPDGSYPWPDEHQRSTVTGELADRIRFALTDGHPEKLSDHAVFMTETKQYGGYSQYTQDNFRYIKVECGEQSKTIEENSSSSAFSLLLEWMDNSERMYALTPEEISQVLNLALANGWKREAQNQPEHDNHPWA